MLLTQKGKDIFNENLKKKSFQGSRQLNKNLSSIFKEKK